MYNILILSVGRRTKLVEYFVKEFSGAGNVVVTDCSEYAPALYIANKHYIVPRMDDPNYIEFILDICQKEKIKGVFSLIDPELELLVSHKHKFNQLDIKVLSSSKEVNNISFDKYKMYQFCTQNNINTVKTFKDLESVNSSLNNGEIDFPLFIKPRCGSASIGIKKVDALDELELIFNTHDDLIVQEFMSGKEYGIDVYVDRISQEVISIFAKEKVTMRAGETDKSISYKNIELFNLIEKFSSKLGVIGQCDMDVFEKEGKFYISEVNPRFGGGYPHAYECGCNFPKYILNNLRGHKNQQEIGCYADNVIMMKCDNLIIKK